MPTARMTSAMTYPMTKQPGIVSTHAVTMRPAMPQRTAERRRVAPTPRIAPEIACVVEIGMPRRVAISMTVPAVVSAAKPCTGVSFVMRTPIVLTVALSCTLLFSTTTIEHATNQERHAALTGQLAITTSGPGLPLVATRNASFTTRGNSRTSFTK